MTAESILSLSNMMRYAVDSKNTADFINLGDEIDQVENLINFYQLRQDHSLQIRFDYEDEIRSEKIIPLVLITLVENIFKHGNLKIIELPAEINIYKIDNQLIIETANLVGINNNNNSLNMGIENIKKRLNYLYGNKAFFEYYINDNNQFRVKLAIEQREFSINLN